MELDALARFPLRPGWLSELHHCFARFAITRDFPWANLLLFAIAGILLLPGLF